MGQLEQLMNNSKMKKILIKINKIISLLEEVNEANFINAFKNIKRIIESMDSDNSTHIKKTISYIFDLYSGIGTFNDLVLDNNGFIDLKLNKELDKLRKELFELTKDMI